MKIVMLAPLYYPHRGGAETLVRCLAEGMVSKGHDVTVITDRRSESLPECESIDGVTIIRTHRYLKRLTTLDHRDSVPWEECILGLRNDLEAVAPFLNETDIVHAHCTVSALPASLLGLRLRAPVVVTPHETTPERDPLGMETTQLFLGLHPIRRVVVGSQCFEKQARKLGVSDSRLSVIPFGVDTDKFRSDCSGDKFRGGLNIAEDEIVITCVGRFKERKRQLDIVEAVRLCCQRPRRVPLRVLLVGSCDAASSEYLDQIRRQIAEYCLESCILVLEDVPQAEMPSLYAASTIVLQPSTAEGLGLAVLEAQASGCAVIASAIDGLTESVHHEETGLLFECGNIPELADCIMRLIEDPNLRFCLATAATKQVKTEFNIKRTVQQTLDEYRKVIEEGERL